jgi:hypothetical protein
MLKYAIRFLLLVGVFALFRTSSADTLTQAGVIKIAPDSNFALGASRKIAGVITDHGRSISLVMQKNDERVKANTPKRILGNWMLTSGFAGNANTYARIKAAGVDEKSRDLFNIYNKMGGLVQVMGVYVDDKGQIHLRWYDPQTDKKPYSSDY